ncbi:SDR family NAD(P)-dependent oxidoreductase [Sunxiuqinia sp. A32]|uniref:SDR family NAD(P)-dependent oxidoreductase n=1 Tax=Sunxiuqinia sp. A32 TaxID=3461496 RepID=UPI004045CE23
MNDTKQQYTLITGASKGLGKELAIECAKRKMNLILVSLPDENLEQVANELKSSYPIQVSYYEADLADFKALQQLTSWVKEYFTINMLINNAGVGGTQLFDKSSLTYLDNMIQLNIRAMTMLTRLLLPELKKREEAYILNVSSLAAFSPVPFKTIYPASKAFIHHFTRGLKAELVDTNVKISVLNPGPIKTNSDVTKRINGQTLYVKLSIMNAEQIAKIAIEKLLRGKSVIIPGFMNQFNAFFIRIVPESFRIFVGTAIFKRDLRKKKTNENTGNRSKRSAWKQPDPKAVAEKY